MRSLTLALTQSSVALARRLGASAARILDFATLTPAALASRFGWVRTGAGTMEDSGGAVRYGAHNLMTNSADITQASWTKTGVTAVSAAEFAETAANAQHGLFRSFSISPGVYTQIIRVRPKSGTRFISVYPQGGSLAAAVFNLQTGARTSVFGGGFIDGGLQLMPDGFYRCWVTGNFTGTTLFAVTYTTNSAADPAPGFAGDTGVSFDVQLQRVINGPIDDAANDLTTVTTTSPVFLMRTPDYTHGVPGLLLEGARTQIIRTARDFSSASWIPQDAATASGATLTFASGVLSRAIQTISPASGTYTISAVFSPADAGKLVRLGFGASNASFFDTGLSADLAIPADGRVSHTMTLVSPALFGVVNRSAGGVQSLTLREGVGCVQVELGAYPTSYIPNPGTGTVTRAADYPQVISGDELTGLIGDGTDFVLYLRYSLREIGAVGLIFELAGAADRGTVNGVVALDASLCVFYGVGFSTQGVLAASSVVGLNKIAVSYSANNMRLSINGGAVVKDLSGAIGGTLGRLALGHQLNVSGQHRDMGLHEIQGRPGQGSIISDAALQALTA